MKIKFIFLINYLNTNKLNILIFLSAPILYSPSQQGVGVLFSYLFFIALSCFLSIWSVLRFVCIASIVVHINIYPNLILIQIRQTNHQTQFESEWRPTQICSRSNKRSNVLLLGKFRCGSLNFVICSNQVPLYFSNQNLTEYSYSVQNINGIFLFRPKY